MLSSKYDWEIWRTNDKTTKKCIPVSLCTYIKERQLDRMKIDFILIIYLLCARCPRSRLTKRKLNISLFCWTYRVDFFIGDGGVLKVFIHKKKVHKCFSKVWYLTIIQNFTLSYCSKKSDFLDYFMREFFSDFWRSLHH